MNKPISLNLGHQQTQSLKQTQRLMMSPQMQQAIAVLQLPIMELEQIISAELEQNPVLEYSENEGEESFEESSYEFEEEREVVFDDFNFEVLQKLDEEFSDHFNQVGGEVTPRTREDEKKDLFREISIVSDETLEEHLIAQLDETVADEKQRELGRLIIGHLDERGFLTCSLDEIAILHDLIVEDLEIVLKFIQGFDPLGVGAKDLRDSLLIQLRGKGKEVKLAYAIVENYFEDLLNNRLPLIQKEMGRSLTEIQKVITEEIATLSFKPGSCFGSDHAFGVVPDVAIYLEGEKLVIDSRFDSLPSLRLNPTYLQMLAEDNVPHETKEYIQQKIASSKWLMKSLNQRSDTLTRIAEVICETQSSFLKTREGNLAPMTMKSVAEKLEVHESTIARAVANKYIATPKGIMVLRSFFTNAYVTDEGEDISSKTVKEVLLRIIEEEDKRKPLSDEALSKMLKGQGIPCARRTVAKYRGELKIGNTTQRRSYA